MRFFVNKKKKYFYGCQHIDEDDISAVREVLQSPFLSQGPILEKFEHAVAEYCGAAYCLAVSNGTDALFLAARGLGLKENDIAITTPLTFVATANSMRHCGASVEFVDIDPATFNLSVDALQRKLQYMREKKKLPKLVVPVHFAGESCAMKELRDLCSTYNIAIIEDACHAFGGEYREKKIGSCQYSDITVFSLHPVKSITSGEGGLILTNNEELYLKIKAMRAHAIDRNSKNSFPWAYDISGEGYNCKISELQCALGLSQLKKIDTFITHREHLVSLYKKYLADFEFIFQYQDPSNLSANHILPILIDYPHNGLTKDEVFNKMKQSGIYLTTHYLPLHRTSYYKKLISTCEKYQNADYYFQRAFSFPLHVSITTKDVRYICKTLINYLAS